MQHPSAVPVPPVKQGCCLPRSMQGGGDSVKAGAEGEELPTRGKEEGEKMQANSSYLPIEMSYKSQESKYINVPS